MANHIVRVRIKDVYIYPHSNGGKPVDALLAAGIKHWADVWRRDYGINYRFVISQTSGFRITSGPVVIRGQHYRGVARSSHIMLHNAWVPGENRWSDTFWNKDRQGFIEQVGLILHHEVAHYWFKYPTGSHAKDVRDLMHGNVGRMLTESLPKMRSKFGTLRRTQAQASAAERRLAVEHTREYASAVVHGPSGYCQVVEV